MNSGSLRDAKLNADMRAGSMFSLRKSRAAAESVLHTGQLRVFFINRVFSRNECRANAPSFQKGERALLLDSDCVHEVSERILLGTHSRGDRDMCRHDETGGKRAAHEAQGKSPNGIHRT